jgi:hypothetical protein
LSPHAGDCQQENTVMAARDGSSAVDAPTKSFIVTVEVSFDSGLEFGYAEEHAASDREVQMEARMAFEPSLDLGGAAPDPQEITGCLLRFPTHMTRTIASHWEFFR